MHKDTSHFFVLRARTTISAPETLAQNDLLVEFGVNTKIYKGEDSILDILCCDLSSRAPLGGPPTSLFDGVSYPTSVSFGEVRRRRHTS